LYCYNPESKSSPLSGKACLLHSESEGRRSNIKSMLVIIFDCQGTVHQIFVPLGQMVNQYYYLAAPDRQRSPKTSRIMEEPNSLIHYDNAPVHTTLSARNTAVIHHLRYSFNLALMIPSSL
jgi:hypothetical protein